MEYLSERHVAVLAAGLAAYREQCRNDAALNVEQGRERAAQELRRIVAECDELTARLANARVSISAPFDPPAPQAEFRPVEFDRGSF
jgi:hypothetical protein